MPFFLQSSLNPFTYWYAKMLFKMNISLFLQLAITSAQSQLKPFQKSKAEYCCVRIKERKGTGLRKGGNQREELGQKVLESWTHIPATNKVKEKNVSRSRCFNFSH